MSPKNTTTLQPKTMGDLPTLREAHKATEAAIEALKKQSRKIWDQINLLTQKRLELDWAIVNTEIAKGLRQPNFPRAENGDDWWKGVFNKPGEERNSGKGSKKKEKEISAAKLAEMEREL